MLPTVFSRTWGWISDCDMTLVCTRKRSTMPRTNGRVWGEVTSTGASPFAGGVLEAFADAGDELGKPRRLHREAAVCGRRPCRRSTREILLPLCRQSDQRQVACGRGVLGADLPGETGSHMFGNADRVARERQRVGDALEDGGEIADRDALVQEKLQHPLDARHRDLRRHDVLDQLALFLRQILDELVHLGIGQQLGGVGLSSSVRCVDSTVAASTTV